MEYHSPACPKGRVDLRIPEFSQNAPKEFIIQYHLILGLHHPAWLHSTLQYSSTPILNATGRYIIITKKCIPNTNN